MSAVCGISPISRARFACASRSLNDTRPLPLPCTGTSLAYLHATAEQNLVLGRHESNQHLDVVVASIANSHGELQFVFVSGQDTRGVRAPGDVFARELCQLLRRESLPILLKYVHVHGRAPSSNKRHHVLKVPCHDKTASG